MSDDRNHTEPSRDEIDRTDGPLLLEFGAAWCGHCQAVAPQVRTLLGKFPEVRHLKVEDGAGQPLGRSFRVKLWPTFVFLRDGRVLQRSVRPHAGEIRQGLDAITRGDGAGHSPSP